MNSYFPSLWRSKDKLKFRSSWPPASAMHELERVPVILSHFAMAAGVTAERHSISSERAPRRMAAGTISPEAFHKVLLDWLRS